MPENTFTDNVHIIGSVRIGTAGAPDTSLHIADTSANGDAVVTFENDAYTYELGIFGSQSDRFLIRDPGTNNTPFVIEKNSGNFAFRVTSTEVVFNELGSATIDFRIESETVTNAFFLDSNGSSEANGLLTLGIPLFANKGFARSATARSIAIDANDDLTVNDEDDLIEVTTGTSSILNTIIGGYDGQEIRIELALADTMTINHNTAGVGRVILTPTAAAVAAVQLRRYHLERSAGGWFLNDA